MIDLSKLQGEVHATTKFLGYKINKRLTIKKLKQEIKEFKHSRFQRNKNAPLVASTIQDDKKFVKYYETYLKGTTHDEAPDIVMVILSYCQEMGVDFETDFMNKYRYNLHRKKKSKN